MHAVCGDARPGAGRADHAASPGGSNLIKTKTNHARYDQDGGSCRHSSPLPACRQSLSRRRRPQPQPPSSRHGAGPSITVTTAKRERDRAKRRGLRLDDRARRGAGRSPEVDGLVDRRDPRRGRRPRRKPARFWPEAFAGDARGAESAQLDAQIKPGPRLPSSQAKAQIVGGRRPIASRPPTPSSAPRRCATAATPALETLRPARSGCALGRMRGLNSDESGARDRDRRSRACQSPGARRRSQARPHGDQGAQAAGIVSRRNAPGLAPPSTMAAS